MHLKENGWEDLYFCGPEPQRQAWDCSEIGNDDRITYMTGNFLTS
jgi:hypothetical protein